MFFSTSIQRYITATLALLVLPMAIGTAIMMNSAGRDVAAASRTISFAKADKGLLQLAASLRSQRGDMQTALLAADDPRPATEQARASFEATVKTVSAEVLGTSLQERENLAKTMNDSAAAALAHYDDLLKEGAKAKGQRSLAATNAWYDSMARVIDDILNTSIQMTAAIRHADPRLAELENFKDNAWLMRAGLGSQCTLLRTTFANGKPIEPLQARKLGELRGQVTAGANNLLVQMKDKGAAPALSARSSTAISEVADVTKKTDELLGKLGTGASPIEPEEWTKLCNGPFSAILAVVSTSLDTIVDTASETYAAALTRLSIAGLVALAVLGIGISSWRGLRNRISRPVVDIRATLERLQAGNLGEPVAPARYPDEIGALSSALETYRENALALEQTRQEREGLQEHQLREAAAGQALVANVARVVAGAKTGDFSGRVGVEGVTGSLRDLAEGVNAINTVVDQATTELAAVLRAVADGDLTQVIASNHSGRFGELREAVNDTVVRLAETVATIQSTASEVSSSAREINAGADDLSRRVEDQASSLEETAATTEELAASVKNSAQSSRQAVSMAGEAMQVAETGGRIIADAVAAMVGIEQAAAKIADITSVIDGIAFQTNLLALNAAVEAARAGDAGKGFAVVASEVRTLAQRSGEASKDISQLIQSSTAQVAAGVRLVREAGDVLEKIVDGSKKVSATVSEISTAANEQANGIEEMSHAVAHLDETTQQNAALAVESAASAAALTSLIGQLRDLVAAFKTNGQGQQAGQRRLAA